MRNLIAVLVPIGLLAACGGPVRFEETATSVPKRDLTLGTAAAPSVEVASKIELLSEPKTRISRPVRRAEPVRVAPEPEPETAVAAPVSESAASPALAPSVPEASQADMTTHELAPGSTVTVIPASTAATGSAGAGGDWSELPGERTRGTGIIMGGGHAGNCGHGGHGGHGGGRGPVSILK
ncbi:MAG: hypothetical protein ACREL3_10385 [Gemmatimonadales bacterium]